MAYFSFLEQIAKEEEERRKKYSVVAQNDALRAWERLGAPTPGTPTAEELNPIGTAYRAAKTPRLTPDRFLRDVEEQAIEETQRQAETRRSITQIESALEFGPDSLGFADPIQRDFEPQVRFEEPEPPSPALRAQELGFEGDPNPFATIQDQDRQQQYDEFIKPFQPALDQHTQEISDRVQRGELTLDQAQEAFDGIYNEVIGGNIRPTEGPLGVPMDTSDPLSVLGAFTTPFVPEKVREAAGGVPFIGPGLEQGLQGVSPAGLSAATGGVRLGQALGQSLPLAVGEELAAEGAYIGARSLTDPIENPFLREGLPLAAAIGAAAAVPIAPRAARQVAEAVPDIRAPDLASEFGGGKIPGGPDDFVPPKRLTPGQEDVPPIEPDEIIPPVREVPEEFADDPKAAEAFRQGQADAEVLPVRPAAIEPDKIFPADPVERLRGLIKEAVPATAETKELVKVRKAEQAAAIQRGLESAGSGYEAMRNSLSALKGEMPKAVFEPPRELMNALEIDDLHVMVRDFYRADPSSSFSAAPTFVALNKILDGALPNESELGLLRKVFGKQIVKTLDDKRPLWRKAADNVFAGFTLWRTFITGGEQSVLLRQAAIPSSNLLNLPITARAAVRSLKAGFSREAAEAIEATMRQTDEFKRLDAAADRAGYRLFTKFAGEGDVLAREEGYTGLERTMVGRIAHGTPIMGQYLRFSERNAVVLLNSIRRDLGAKWLKILDSKAPSGVASALEEEEVARAMAVLTGRGKIPAGDLAQVLGRALFSAQLQASTIQTPFLLASTNATVRRLAATEIASFIVFGTTLLSLASLAGYKVETNLLSTNAYKIKIGPTRIDPWRGFQQYATMITRAATGKTKTSIGDIRDINRLDVGARFWTNKTSPPLTLGFDILRGETTIGEKLEPTLDVVKREAFNRFLMLATRDVIDAVKEHDSWLGAMIAPLVWFGMGAQSYTTPSEKTAHQIGEMLLKGELEGEYDDVPLKIGDLDRGDQQAYLEKYPDVVESLEESAEETLAGVSDRSRNVIRGTSVQRALKNKDAALDEVKADAISGDPGNSEFRGNLEDAIRDATRTYGINVQDAYEQFPADEKEANSEEKRLIERYREFQNRHQDRFTETDPERKDELYTQYDTEYESSFSAKERAKLLKLRLDGDHSVEQARTLLSLSLSDYYDQDQGEKRERFRRRNPEVDGALWALGRTSVVMRRANREAAADAWYQLYGERIPEDEWGRIIKRRS